METGIATGPRPGTTKGLGAALEARARAMRRGSIFFASRLNIRLLNNRSSVADGTQGAGGRQFDEVFRTYRRILSIPPLPPIQFAPHPAHSGRSVLQQAIIMLRPKVVI